MRVSGFLSWQPSPANRTNPTNDPKRLIHTVSNNWQQLGFCTEDAAGEEASQHPSRPEPVCACRALLRTEGGRSPSYRGHAPGEEAECNMFQQHM